MSTRTRTVTKAQAEATLAAVKAQFAAFLNPMTLDGTTYDPTYPDPVLVWDYTDSGHPAIAWEEGPDEWVYTIHGGTSEEEASLMALAAEEFGATLPVPVRKPATIPAGVFVEPVNHCALGVYPA
jgi:hypothetical protein